MRWVILLGLGALLSGCFGTDKTDSVALGEATFAQYCVSCHGEAAQGLTQDWKQRLPNGKFPAPPLNGSAHAWHHSPKTLLRTIDEGGVKLGGWMPGFKDQLSEREKQALIDYIYSLWPESIQQRYDKQFK